VNDIAASTHEILSALIAHPTVSRDSNLAMIEWIRAYLDSHAVAADLIYDVDRRKANLWATIGPDADGGVVLSGHTDVVPVDGQDWHTDPFRAEARDSRVFGRGTCDMKGFIACALAQVPAWKRQPLKRPVHLAFSYDEEIGCLGVQGLIEHMQATGLEVSGCVVGEPTGMDVVVAHKGCMSIHGRVRGRPAHSSLPPRGVNAIDYAIRLISHAQDLALREQQKGPHDEGFEVPHSTLAATMIHGGVAVNIIPEHCEFSLDYRYLPGTDPKGLLSDIEARSARLTAEMQSVAPEAGIQLHHETRALPFMAERNGAWTALIQKLVRTNKTRYITLGSEAAYFQGVDVPTVVCGPGSISQAHQANEYVARDQLSACNSFLEEMGQRLCDLR
jgi:acetylornithine deacetylase